MGVSLDFLIIGLEKLTDIASFLHSNFEIQSLDFLNLIPLGVSSTRVTDSAAGELIVVSCDASCAFAVYSKF